jgi:type IV secretory pathway VirB2 component (pilin)
MKVVNFFLKSWRKALVGGTAFFVGNVAMAANASRLPFVKNLDLLKEAISGPFLAAAAIIMIVVTCLMLAFGEWGDGFKRVINIVLWLSVAFGSVSFVSTLFGV